MGLKILQIMAEEGFFTDLEIEVKSGVLSGVHVELFAKGTLVVFLNRLADPYDEVARLVYWFIERIKEPATITWEMLYKMGRELCLSRRADNAEGGAKVLSLCYKFSAINGRNSIWEEIWNSIVEDVKTEDLKRITIEKPLHGRLILLRYNVILISLTKFNLNPEYFCWCQSDFKIVCRYLDPRLSDTYT